MSLSEDQEVVEAFGAQTLHPAFGVGVHVGRPWPDAIHLTALGPNTASNESVNLGSLSISRCVAPRSQSAICIVALRACCATHFESGLAVGLETMTRRVPM